MFALFQTNSMKMNHFTFIFTVIHSYQYIITFNIFYIHIFLLILCYSLQIFLSNHNGMNTTLWRLSAHSDFNLFKFWTDLTSWMTSVLRSKRSCLRDGIQCPDEELGLTKTMDLSMLWPTSLVRAWKPLYVKLNYLDIFFLFLLN